MYDTAPAASCPPFAEVKLGDILRLPDGRQQTVRACESFPVPVGTMAGFLVCEELELLVSLPANRQLPVSLFAPMYEEPELVRAGIELFRGEMTYWAPHLPASSEAMGALQFRIVALRGSLHPAVVVYRTGEPVVFIHVGDLAVSQLSIQRMVRGEERPSRHRRHAALLRPLDLPSHVPAHHPTRTPAAVRAENLAGRVFGG